MGLLTLHCLLPRMRFAFVVGFFLCTPFDIAAGKPTLLQSQASPAFHHLGSQLTFPVYHRSSPPRIESTHHYDEYALKRQTRARRILDDLAPAPAMEPAAAFSPVPAFSPVTAFSPPSPSGNIPALRSKVVTLSEPFGQYFAELQIGSPAEPLAVIIDTGSQVLWIQCSPCQNCGVQVSAYPIFDPSKSSSFATVMCDSAACSNSDGSIAFGCFDSGACEYKVSYGDNSNSSGNLATETLTFTMANATSNGASSSFQLLNFVFGCGTDNVGVETQFNASGLMGLDMGPYSVISQLNVDVFSYCFPNRENNVDATGYLTFGTSNTTSSASSSSPSLQYTPMLQNNYSSFLSYFYYLGLTGVSVNGQLLDIPAAAFKLDLQTGTGGTVIDSGTTLTTFVDEAYTVIINAFESHVDPSLQKVDLEENSTTLCYAVPLSKQKGAPTAPTVTLHFEGSTAAMELTTEHLFHLYGSDTTNNYYCLAMANGGPLSSGAKNFIGNFQQQNFLIEYDIGKSRVGFAPTQCSPAKEKSASSSKPVFLWHLGLIIMCVLFFL